MSNLDIRLSNLDIRMSSLDIRMSKLILEFGKNKTAKNSEILVAFRMFFRIFGLDFPNPNPSPRLVTDGMGWDVMGCDKLKCAVTAHVP